MRVLDLFAGIGGFSLAAHWMGWETVAFVESAQYPPLVLNRHFPSVPIYGDVREFDGKPFAGAVDVICGGFPCQDISYAKSWTTDGQFERSGLHGKRSGLWFEYARIIEEIRPQWVVAENVAALANQGLDVVLQSLSEIGYDAEWRTIPATFVGAPHLRERIWIVAYPQRVGRDEESIVLRRISGETVSRSPQWEFSRAICSTYGKKALPESFGIPDGLPGGIHRGERLAALGNTIVPHIAYEIFKAIKTSSLHPEAEAPLPLNTVIGD